MAEEKYKLFIKKWGKFKVYLKYLEHCFFNVYGRKREIKENEKEEKRVEKKMRAYGRAG